MGETDLAYHITGYKDEKDQGTAYGPTASGDVEFETHLLLEARAE
jgi:hypothetical protein